MAKKVEKKGFKKIFTGEVISTKMEKTVTVRVERVFADPVYKKRVKRARKYQVHDEMGAAVGDTVRFVACRPYSRKKRWIVTDILGKEKKDGTAKK